MEKRAQRNGGDANVLLWSIVREHDGLNLVGDHDNGRGNVGFYRIYRVEPEFTLVLHWLV